MENQPATRPSRRKNAQPPRGTAGETSKASSSRPTAPKPPVIPVSDTTVQPPVPATSATTAVVIPTTPAVDFALTPVANTDESETERLVRDMLKTIKKTEKPSDVLARMAEALRKAEAASQFTPLEIPPRPPVLTETSTSQALAALAENPQIAPQTLTQEIPPPAEIPHSETQTSTEPPVEGGEENQTRDGPDGEDTPSVEAREGEQRSPSGSEEGRRDMEGETAGERESEEEGEEGSKDETVVEDKGVERAEGSLSEGEEMEYDRDVGVEGSEGDGEGNVDEEDVREGDERKAEESEGKEDETSEGEEEPGNVYEREQDAGCLNAEDEVETEVINVDDLPSEDKVIPEDGRTMRRHSRRIRKVEEAPPVNQLQRLRLRDEDGSDDDVSQVQEPPAGTTDVSPEISEERYEAETKRRGQGPDEETSSSLKSGGD